MWQFHDPVGLFKTVDDGYDHKNYLVTGNKQLNF